MKVVDKKHACKELSVINTKRGEEFELEAKIAKDVDGWFMYISSEIINIIFCPFCGAKLK